MEQGPKAFAITHFEEYPGEKRANQFGERFISRLCTPIFSSAENHEISAEISACSVGDFSLIAV
jgi:hypothetical protein